MSELKLKCCPFCGGSARVVLDYQDNETWAQCTTRKPKRCPMSSTLIAIEEWNRRTQPEATKPAQDLGERNTQGPLLIARIKRYKEAFGCSTAEAKEACEYGRDLNSDKTAFVSPTKKDLSAAILALQTICYEDQGRWYIGIRGDSDVTEIVAAALASPADALVAMDARKLNWGDVSRPSKEIGYDHVIAQTPFGRVLITWKGWKDYPSFEIEDHPLEIVRNWCGSSLESAKEEAERVYFEAINTAIQAQKDGHNSNLENQMKENHGT